MNLSEFDSIEDFMKAEEKKVDNIKRLLLLSNKSMKLSTQKIAEISDVAQSFVLQLKKELKAEKPEVEIA